MSLEPAHYVWLADLTVGVHFAFVVFVVAGQVLVLAGWWRRWEWVRGRTFRALHLAAIAVVVAQAWLGVVCPLTVLENHLRELAGLGAYERTFIGHWLHRLLFYSAPGWVFTTAYTAFGALVLLSFLGYPPRRRPGL